MSPDLAQMGPEQCCAVAGLGEQCWPCPRPMAGMKLAQDDSGTWGCLFPKPALVGLSV